MNMQRLLSCVCPGLPSKDLTATDLAATFEKELKKELVECFQKN